MRYRKLRTLCRLWIPQKWGSYVCGYTIATDTGIAYVGSGKRKRPKNTIKIEQEKLTDPEYLEQFCVQVWEVMEKYARKKWIEHR